MGGRYPLSGKSFLVVSQQAVSEAIRATTAAQTIYTMVVGEKL